MSKVQHKFGFGDVCFFATQGSAIQNRQTKRCLEVNDAKLVMQKCSGQHWRITNVVKDF